MRASGYSTIRPRPPPRASSAGSFVSVFEPQSRMPRSAVGRLTTVARIRSAQSSSGTVPFGDAGAVAVDVGAGAHLGHLGHLVVREERRRAAGADRRTSSPRARISSIAARSFGPVPGRVG